MDRQVCPFCQKTYSGILLTKHFTNCAVYLKAIAQNHCPLCNHKVKGFISLHLKFECNLGINLSFRNSILECGAGGSKIFRDKMDSQQWQGLSVYKSAFRKWKKSKYLCHFKSCKLLSHFLKKSSIGYVCQLCTYKSGTEKARYRIIKHLKKSHPNREKFLASRC